MRQILGTPASWGLFPDTLLGELGQGGSRSKNLEPGKAEYQLSRSQVKAGTHQPSVKKPPVKAAKTKTKLLLSKVAVIFMWT